MSAHVCISFSGFILSLFLPYVNQKARCHADFNYANLLSSSDQSAWCCTLEVLAGAEVSHLTGLTPNPSTPSHPAYATKNGVRAPYPGTKTQPRRPNKAPMLPLPLESPLPKPPLAGKASQPQHQAAARTHSSPLRRGRFNRAA